MPERDYFDFTDEAEPQPTPLAPMEPVQKVQTYDEPTLPVPKRHRVRNSVAVLIFLLVLAGCGFMIYHQIQQDLKPRPSNAKNAVHTAGQ